MKSCSLLVVTLLFSSPLLLNGENEISALESELLQYSIRPVTEEEPVEDFSFRSVRFEELSNFAEERGYSLLIAPSVKDNLLNISLRNYSFSKALPHLIRAAGADWLVDGERIIVFESVDELKTSFADSYLKRKSLENELQAARHLKDETEVERDRPEKRTSTSPALRTTQQQSLEDFSIETEDGRSVEIIATLNGPNGTPYDLAVITPGPWGMDLSHLEPDNYTLYLEAEGYAPQRLSITYKDGEFVTNSHSGGNTLVLYKKRYITFEVVWNSVQQRDLLSGDVMREIVTATHNGRHSIIGSDYLFVQTIAAPGSDRTSLQTGTTPALRKHRYNRFFGVVYPETGTDFEAALEAPTNDQYKSDGMVTLVPGEWFFLRVSGHLPEMITYLKIRTISIETTPPIGANLLKERTPRWHSAKDMAKRLGVKLPD
ncbi:MAG: hypothetical protein AAGJ81_04120 [Verrucomicrobiota bacterium]